jgi:hypothetical protein
MLDLMSIRNLYNRATNSNEFIELLSDNASSADVIHITTHGVYETETRSRRRPKFVGFWTPGGTVTLKNIENANLKLSGKTVVSTACFSGQKTPREKFPEERPQIL